ncbi:MAG: amidohydrolase [Marinilabiliales bacterium]|nr:MAG: amidohydrolase [Marinilabiliales bacterium]
MLELKKIRKYLHKYPELSGQESETSIYITKQLQKLGLSDIEKIGGNGIIAKTGTNEGISVLFRADIDALPIQEDTSNDNHSAHDSVMHACGHDGHTTILLGLAEKIMKNPPKKGNVYLLFQPAEETGMGAEQVINDKKWEKYSPDFSFALHNIPGFPLHSILIKEEGFASASKGVVFKLKGKTSHAAEPEFGINPAVAVSKIIAAFEQIKEQTKLFRDKILLTFINIQLGEIAFGTSAGYAEVRVTIRAFNNQDIELLSKLCSQIATRIAEDEKLEIDIEFVEEFPATINHKENVHAIIQAAEENKLEQIKLDSAFKWSEDFGHFGFISKAAMFGLGAGEKHPALHNPDYDFPDELIESGVNMFYSIYKNILLND